MPKSEIDPHDETMRAATSPANTMSGTSPAGPRRGVPTWALLLMLSVAAVAAAVLVFVVLSAVNRTPAPANMNLAPTASTEELLPEEAPPPPAMSTLRIVAPSIEGARIFIDAVDRGPLQAQMAFDLEPGPHSVEARRDDRIVAHTPVEIEPGASTQVTLDASRPARIETTRHPGRSSARAARRAATQQEAAEPPAEQEAARVDVTGRAAGAESTAPVAHAPRALSDRSERNDSSEPGDEGAATAPAGATAGLRPAPPAPMVPQPTAAPMTPTGPTAPAMTPARPAAPATPAALQRELRALQPQVQRCVGAWHGTLPVAVTVAGNGRVGARIGRGPSGEQRRCVQRLLMEELRRRFPAGSRVTTRHTYRL